MTHKLITTENYLLVVDDSEIKEGEYFYSIRDLIEVALINYPPNEHYGKIIAHLPLNNSPILEGVDLLPPLEDEVEIAEKALFTFLDKYFNTKRNWRLVQGQDTHTDKEAIMMLYSDIIKAKEKYKYTDEDIRNAIVKGFLMGMDREHDITEVVEQIMQSLQQPKMPVGFECDMVKGLPIHNSNNVNVKALIPTKQNTKINSQGLTQWVGRYIYG